MGVTDTENLAAASPFKGLLSTGHEGLSSLQLSTPPLWGGCLHFTGALNWSPHSLSGAFLENQLRNQADKR